MRIPYNVRKSISEIISNGETDAESILTSLVEFGIIDEEYDTTNEDGVYDEEYDMQVQSHILKAIQLQLEKQNLLPN